MKHSATNSYFQDKVQAFVLDEFNNTESCVKFVLQLKCLKFLTIKLFSFDI